MRLALALSGGGFRATLFHLGVVRYMHDADLLVAVSDIAAVSGGSILAAHMGLWWDKYVGNDREFDEIAKEIVEFTQKDIRGKILRRLPLCLISKAVPKYSLGRSTLLEQYYSKHLFHDKELETLSASGPTVHIMATNLTTGSSCSFSRNGLYDNDPDSPRETRATHMKLSLAVACSSAFPGFFPPLPITAKMLGVRNMNWVPDPQLFTDGGVYDNLGLRKIKLVHEASYDEVFFTSQTIESWSALCQRVHKSRDDLKMPEGAVYSLLDDSGRSLIDSVVEREHVDAPTMSHLAEEFNILLGRPNLCESSCWTRSQLREAGATANELRAGQHSAEEVSRINRELLETAFSEHFRVNDLPIDQIVVSDAGAPFDWTTRRLTGVFSTALRAVNLTMNRIHDLELGNVEASSDTHVRIDDEDFDIKDAATIHPAVRSQLRSIRTDFDRFSSSEIRALVLHGYCVARKNLGHLVAHHAGADQSPWDPIPTGGHDLSSPRSRRLLSKSAVRRLRVLTVGLYLFLLIVAAAGVLYASAFLQQVWHIVAVSDEVMIERQVVYARFVSFEDRRISQNTGKQMRIGQPGTIVSQQERQVFDEAHYTMGYYLKRHRAEGMTMHISSSGICSVLPIIPSSITVSSEQKVEYQRAGGGRLDYTVPLVTKEDVFRDYVLLSVGFYNGYQYQKQGRDSVYQSDGGVHIHFPTDELIMIIDFRDLDFDYLISGEPILVVKREEDGKPDTLAPKYEDGILYSDVIRNLKKGGSVHFDWMWVTEGQ